MLSNYFYIDFRSLRLFRKLISLVLIYDLLIRLTDLTAHYSNEGILPLDILYKYEWNKFYWSLLTFSESKYFLIFFFILILIFAVFLLIGHQPRLMTLLCWIGILSIQNRNPVISQGGDDLLRMMLFWAIFLPLSVGTSKNKGFLIVNNVASMAILCQVLFTFLFSGLFKDVNEWFYSGSSVYYAVSLDQISRPLGKWLSHQYRLTIFLSRLTYLSELIIFPIFLFPVYRDKIRLLIIFFLLLFNIATIFLFMIGIFPLCFLAAIPLFIPTYVWDKLEVSRIGKKINRKVNQIECHSERNFQSFGLTLAKQFTLGLLFTLIILWNIASLTRSILRFPEVFSPCMYFLRLNQSWGMFAPTVLRQDGWLVIKAQLINGRIIDLNSPGLKLSYDKPLDIIQRYKNDRWRKFTEQLFIAKNFLRLTYADYLIKNWDKNIKQDEKKIKNISIIYMEEVTKPYNEKLVIEKIILYSTFKENMPGNLN